MADLLIIFVKNPVLGKVKTRLARTIGEEKALSVYQKLMAATKEATLKVPMEKQVAYSDFVPEHDIWDTQVYQKVSQKGDDLGERMHFAFNDAFRKGYEHVCLIGSDIYELEAEMIERAFKILESNDLVIGPAVDGGYYLIGMNELHHGLFKNKAWGTDRVLESTIRDVAELDLTYELLAELNDIDELEDIREKDRAYLLS